jgi:hypothetical protein
LYLPKTPENLNRARMLVAYRLSDSIAFLHRFLVETIS